jgi:hypothetical protein
MNTASRSPPASPTIGSGGPVRSIFAVAYDK